VTTQETVPQAGGQKLARGGNRTHNQKSCSAIACVPASSVAYSRAMRRAPLQSEKPAKSAFFSESGTVSAFQRPSICYTEVRRATAENCYTIIARRGRIVSIPRQCQDPNQQSATKAPLFAVPPCLQCISTKAGSVFALTPGTRDFLRDPSACRSCDSLASEEVCCNIVR
jgi:hypothetical protein